MQAGLLAHTLHPGSCICAQFAAILQLYMAKYGDAKEQSKGQPKKRRKASAFIIFSNEMREKRRSARRRQRGCVSPH